METRQGAPRPLYPAPKDFILWTPICEIACVGKNLFPHDIWETMEIFPRAIRKQKNGTGENKFSPLPFFFVFPDALHPLGGRYAARPVDIDAKVSL